MISAPLPKNQYNNDLSINAPNDLDENELMLGIKAMRIRVNHADVKTSNLNGNDVSDGRGLKVNTKKYLMNARDLKKIFTRWFVKNSGMDLLHAKVQ